MPETNVTIHVIASSLIKDGLSKTFNPDTDGKIISTVDEIKVNNIPGVGCSWSNNKIVVGKALETIEEDGMHKVLCLIKPS